MPDRPVSSLKQEYLLKAREKAEKDLEELVNSGPLEGVVKGEDRSGWMGMINVGLVNGKKEYIIHTSLEGPGRRDRNIEGDKIMGYLMAHHVTRLLPEEERTVYVPPMRGHKVVFENQERGILTREFYVDYEPRQLIDMTDIDMLEYAYLLGRNIARFMYVGMLNMPRHLRPNLIDGNFRTCMIDLDSKDPRTFYWNPCDAHKKGGLNYMNSMENEQHFLRNAREYFLGTHLPEHYSDVEKGLLHMMYMSGFMDEVKQLKGQDFPVDRFK